MRIIPQERHKVGIAQRSEAWTLLRNALDLDWPSLDKRLQKSSSAARPAAVPGLKPLAGRTPGSNPIPDLVGLCRLGLGVYTIAATGRTESSTSDRFSM